MNVFEAITKSFIEAIEKDGSLPWEKPWNFNDPARNIATGREYTGVNAVLLTLWQVIKNYPTNAWVGESQIDLLEKRHGIEIEIDKSTYAAKVLVPQTIEVKRGDEVLIDRNGDPVTKTFFIYRRVWNVSQLKNFPMDSIVPIGNHQPIEYLEQVFSTMQNPPKFQHGGDAAWYDPSTDLIQMPAPGTFTSSIGYYLTRAHETIHATGHKSRLGRLTNNHMDNNEYSFEELVAELGAQFLMASCSIDVGQHEFKNSTAYLTGWLAALKANPNMLINAATAAAKAVEYIRTSAPVPVS